MALWLPWFSHANVEFLDCRPRCSGNMLKDEVLIVVRYS